MLPELVQSGCMPMLWGFFSNDDPGLTLTVLLYGWQLIEHWMLKFVLIQYVFSTQVSDTGPVVLWLKFVVSGVLKHAPMVLK